MQLLKARKTVKFWAIVLISAGTIGLLNMICCCFIFVSHPNVFSKAAEATNNEHLQAMIMDLVFAVKAAAFMIIPALSIIMIMAGARMINYLRIEDKQS
jgi:hypothetical protein